MVAVAWREFKGLLLHPAEVLETILTRHGLLLSLILGMIGYYWSTLQVSELLVPSSLGRQSYFLVGFPMGLGRMALTVLLVHAAYRVIARRQRRWVDLLSLWGYTQLPGIVLSALSLVFSVLAPSASMEEVGILWVLSIVAIALLLSMWGLILKLQALKVCYDLEGRRLAAVITLALVFYGSFTLLERSFIDEHGLIPQKALLAMERSTPPVMLGRKALSLPFDTLTYHLRSPERGEVVGFVLPGMEGFFPLRQGFRVRSIGRIVGLPGEKVEVREGRAFVDDQALPEPYLGGPLLISFPPTTVPPEHFFIVGDNREVPVEAYGGGIVPEKRIRGRLTGVGQMKWRLMVGQELW